MEPRRRALIELEHIRSALAHSAPEIGWFTMTWDSTNQTASFSDFHDDDGIPSSPADKPSAIPMPESAMHLLALTDDNGDIPVASRMDGYAPIWALALDHVCEHIDAGLEITQDDVGDALWATLISLGLPAFSVSLDRIRMASDFGEPQFAPIRLNAPTVGYGKAWSEDLFPATPTLSIASAVAKAMSYLGEQEQRRVLQGHEGDIETARVLSRVTIPL